MEAMLEVQELVKDFGGLRAVNRCSFQVARGTITGLIGPNGAGKTTVFNLITGFYRPDGGRVLFKGEEITGLPPYRIFHKGICRTFQITKEHKQMTVLENLMLVPPGQLGERLAGYIQRLRDEGVTFLLIEHDMNLVMNLCNPVIVMSEGRRLAEGPPEEVRSDRRVLEAYLGGQYVATE